MPPKAAATDVNCTDVIPASCVSILLITSSNTTITKQQLNMMSAVYSNRTASNLEHQFRSIIAKAEEVKAQVDSGRVFTPVPPDPKQA
jgi:hypothetical protein